MGNLKEMYAHASVGKGIRTVCSQCGRRTGNLVPAATPVIPAVATRSLPGMVGCTSAMGVPSGVVRTTATGEATAAEGELVAAVDENARAAAGGDEANG